MSNRLYSKKSVWDAALDRIRWLYDEFDTVGVNTSGGKDSDVILRLAIEVAREKGRLPVEATFVDQEAEWDSTVAHMRLIRDDPDVNLTWLQVPLRLFNSTSGSDPWLICWDPDAEAEWIRPKEPDSTHDNTFGTDRFADLLSAVARATIPDGRSHCQMTGVRAEESPARLLGLTVHETYKGETWGLKGHRPDVVVMHPIYDWGYRDVWKSIHDNGWPYNRLYDLMYQFGMPLRSMRVSNFHHETALVNLFTLQEIEPDTWERVTARLSGINTAGHMQGNFVKVKDLPWMFGSWREYRDYLLDNLITDPEIHGKFTRLFASTEGKFHPPYDERMIRVHVASILVNDYHGTKIAGFSAAHGQERVNKGRISGRTHKVT